MDGDSYARLAKITDGLKALGMLKWTCNGFVAGASLIVAQRRNDPAMVAAFLDVWERTLGLIGTQAQAIADRDAQTERDANRLEPGTLPPFPERIVRHMSVRTLAAAMHDYYRVYEGYRREWEYLPHCDQSPWIAAAKQWKERIG